jgi:hypothetical protein
MRSAGKPTHIRPNFRQKDLCQPPFNAWDRLQAQENLFLGSKPLGNLNAEPDLGLL